MSAAPARRRRRGEAGMSMIETIVALVLVSLAVVGIVGAFANSVKLAATSQNDSQSETAMRSVVDQVRSATLAYQPCVSATGSGYVSAITVPAGYTAVFSVMRPDPAKVVWGSTPALETPRMDCTLSQSYPSSCPANHTCDYGLQRISVTLTNSGAQSVPLVQVVYKGATS